MDQNTVLLVGLIVIGAAMIAVALIFRRAHSFKSSIKGPAGTGLDVEVSAPTSDRGAGATVEDATSWRGEVKAEDHTGAGAAVRRAEAEGDVSAVSTTTPREAPDAKKA